MRENDSQISETEQSVGKSNGHRTGAETSQFDERLFRLMVESAREYAIFATDLKGSIVSWNNGAEHLFGYRENQILGKSFAVLFTAEDRRAGIPRREMAAARETGRAEDERWHVRRDGSRFWASGLTMPLTDDDGNLQGYVKIARDLTERKRAEENLSSYEARFQEIIRQSPLSTFVQDATGRVKYVNPAFIRLWGVTLEDLKDYNPLHDEQADALGIKPFIERAFAGEIVEVPPIYYDPKQTSAVGEGNARWVKTFAYPIKDENGCVLEVVTMHEDVSDRIETQEELVRSEQRLALAQEAGNIGSFDWDIVADRALWTAKLESVFGLPPGGFGGSRESWRKYVHPDDLARCDAETAHALAHKLPELNSEFRIIRADNGETRWIEARTRIFYDRRKRPVRMIGVNLDITARKRAEEELRRNRERFEALVMATTQIVWTTDASGTVNADSPTWREFSGQSLEEWMTHWWDVIHPDDRETARNAWQRAIETESSYEAVYRLRHKSGEYRWTAARGVPLRDEDGSIREWVGMNTDITDQRLAEQRLRESEEFSRSIITSSPDCFKILDVEGRLEFMNESGQCLMEIDDFEAIRNRLWPDLWHEDGQEKALRAVELAKQGEVVRFQGFCPTAKGRPKWWDVIVTPVRGSRGDVVKIVSVSRDISQIKGAEGEREELLRREQAALRQSELEGEKLRSLFLQAPALISIARGPEHVFELVHPLMYQLLGNRDFLGRPVRECIPEALEQGFVALMDNVYHTGETYFGKETPAVVNMPEGGQKQVYFDFIYQPWRDLDGKIAGVMIFAVDVTERVLARQLMEKAAAEREQMLAREQQLRQTAEEASRLKDEFLAMVSHELRTPLNSILGWSQMMRSGVVKSDQYDRAIETIDRSARSQAQIIDDLLDITRIVTGKLRLNIEEVDLAKIIDSALQTVRPAAQAKSIGLFIDTQIPQAEIFGDPERLQQVVWNLLSNAVKFTPKGGEVFVRLESKGSHLKLTVRDTGEGIDPAFLPFVFDRFSQADMSSTRRKGGLGLGLSIVRHLVEMHGGSVDVSSAGKGQGTTFTITFPVKRVEVENIAERPAESEADEPVSLPSVRLDDVRILVVDDEPDAREVLTILLEERGARVRVAHSVQEALAAIAAEVPDILVSDIAMPDEDGYDLIRKIRGLPEDRGGRVPAVALTAYASQSDRKKALKAGFQSHVAKPVDQNVLVTILASLV